MSAIRCPVPEVCSARAQGAAGSGARGFTLVELVVVVAVIGLWALTLAPVLARTRPNVRAVQCLNNLKQWSFGQCMAASENADMLPTDGMGANKLYPGSPPPTGTPDDLYAWFNVVPACLREKGLAYYYHLPPGDPRKKMPFPGTQNAPPFWECPSATMSASDYGLLAFSGQSGFFSYTDNMDLKQGSSYPNWMPKPGALPKPSATVLMFDAAFNPVTEVVNGSPSYNSVNPANRFRSVGARHDLGTVMAFCDGHAYCFKVRNVTNAAIGTTPSGEPRNPEIIWNWIERQQYP